MWRLLTLSRVVDVFTALQPHLVHRFGRWDDNVSMLTCLTEADGNKTKCAARKQKCTHVSYGLFQINKLKVSLKRGNRYYMCVGNPFQYIILSCWGFGGKKDTTLRFIIFALQETSSRSWIPVRPMMQLRLDCSSLDCICDPNLKRTSALMMHPCTADVALQSTSMNKRVWHGWIYICAL